MNALIVIDMQKDFCYKNGSLYVNGVERIFEPTRRVIETARRAMPVIFTQDWHRVDDSEFKIWPKHCIMNTWGAEVIDELKPREEDYFVKKRRYSAFYCTDLDLLLRELDVKRIYLCGVVTNICVLHTAGDAVLRGYEVSVIRDCTAALSDYEYEYGIRHMENVFKAEIITSDEFLKRF